MSARRKTWRARLALAAGTLALALVAAEVGLRIAGFNPLREIRSADMGRPFLRPSADARMRYELTPASSGPGFGRAEVRINAHGFRDEEVQPKRRPGVARIVALGDSVTFGAEVEAERTWPERLERLIDENLVPCEVLNLGVSGYDTLQETAFLARVGLHFSPDVIVVGYCVNDLGTQSVELSHILRAERYASWPYASRIVTWLQLRYDRWQLVHRALDLNEERRFRRDNQDTIAPLDDLPELRAEMAALAERLVGVDPPLPHHDPLTWYTSEAHVGKLRFSLEELARVAGDVPVVVAVIPWLATGALEDAWDQAYAIVERLARDAGLDVVQLAPLVREAGPAALRAKPTDRVHVNERGHERIAYGLATHLRDAGLFSE